MKTRYFFFLVTNTDNYRERMRLIGHNADTPFGTILSKNRASREHICLHSCIRELTV